MTCPPPTASTSISACLGGSIAGIVDAFVTGSYGHSWSTGHSFTTGVVNTVPAGYFGEITAIAPMIRDTGDFTITMGNTTWNLAGVYFDTPNPDGAEHFGYDQHPLTQALKDTLPKTAVVTNAKAKSPAALPVACRCPGGAHTARPITC